MARKAFFSFHYKPDNWRASQVRNMGVIEGNQTVSDNTWEEITKGGDPAIANWINTQMSGKSCAIVLIGSSTAGRKWINYEFTKAWDDGKGLLGIYVHNLKDKDQSQTVKGANPFSGFTVGTAKTPLSQIVKAYDPSFSTSTLVYSHISANLADWVEEAITIRNAY